MEQQLAARGLLVMQGTLLDATLVAAQVRRPQGGATGAGSPRDPDAAWARRGPQARFGYKLHLGVDADSELVRRAVLTPANVNETTVADGLIAGDDQGRCMGMRPMARTRAEHPAAGSWGPRIG